MYLLSFLGSEIPTVSVSKFSVLHHGNEVTIACNVTAGQGSRTYYKKISWYKDGFRVQSVRCPDQYIPEETLGPLLVRFGSGGNYTCVLEVLLRHVTKYTVSDYTLIRGELYILKLQRIPPERRTCMLDFWISRPLRKFIPPYKGHIVAMNPATQITSPCIMCSDIDDCNRHESTTKAFRYDPVHWFNCG